MLLPSALCDSSSPSTPTHHKTRYQPSRSLFASPPQTPTTITTITNIYSSCRALQSMLTPPNQLPSPPTEHAAAPFKLRLRARKPDSSPSPSSSTPHDFTPRKKISKRHANAPAPPRGVNKRRRAADDEMDRSGCEEDLSCSEDADEEEDEHEYENWSTHRTEIARPSTPKRARIAPEILPLGLERSDYHTLHLQQVIEREREQEQSQIQPSLQPSFSMAQYPILSGFDFVNPSSSSSSSSSSYNLQFNHASSSSSTSHHPISSHLTETLTTEAQEWTTEDDRLLVELVLEKLRLTKSEWQDCARSLGKDRGSVGRRWKSLVGAGDVGLRGRGGGVGSRGVERRPRIHGTWR